MLELNNIYNVDCLEGIKKLSNESIDLVVTSPPYFNVKEYSTWNTYEEFLKFLKDIFKEVYRVLKEGRMCAVNISTIIVPRRKRSEESKRLALPFHFVNLMEDIGFKFLEDIIWVKPEGASKNRNGGFFRHRQPVAYKPNVINEYIFVFQKPMNGLIDKIVRSYKGETKERSLVADGYERTNVWYMGTVSNSKHPAPYPKELSDRLVSYYSYVGDIVLDPFMGSGTTALSCIDFDRNYIGFEIHKEYIELANKRISKFNKLN